MGQLDRFFLAEAIFFCVVDESLSIRLLLETVQGA